MNGNQREEYARIMRKVCKRTRLLALTVQLLHDLVHAGHHGLWVVGGGGHIGWRESICNGERIWVGFMGYRGDHRDTREEEEEIVLIHRYMIGG